MYRRAAGRLTVNALHKCSHVPVELVRGLHQREGVHNDRNRRARLLSEEADKTIRSSFPWIINEGTLIASSTAPLSNSRTTLFFFKLDNAELKDGLIPCAVLGCKNRSCLFFCTNWVQDLKEFGLEVRRGKDRQKEL